MKAAEQPKGIESSKELGELKQFEVEMEQISRGFALVKEIRNSLEKALRDLS